VLSSWLGVARSANDDARHNKWRAPSMYEMEGARSAALHRRPIARPDARCASAHQFQNRFSVSSFLVCSRRARDCSAGASFRGDGQISTRVKTCAARGFGVFFGVSPNCFGLSTNSG
jgi:hypothetical protein